MGILLIVGGICAALPFQRMATRGSSQANSVDSDSETIEWRSNDFTLEVTAQPQPLKETVSPHERPTSPAFGQGSQTINRVPATLDNVTQPPSLAGDYEVATNDPLKLAGESDPEAVAGSSTDGRPLNTDTPLQSVAITHQISDGDTLEDLAETHLGSRLRWTEIYNANPEILDNPEVLPIGVTIVILPRLRPSSPTQVTTSDSLVPVSKSDLRRFRDADSRPLD